MKNSFTVLFLLKILSFSSICQQKNSEIPASFANGEKYFNAENPTLITDKYAKKYFLKIINSKNINKENAVFFVNSNKYLGVIYQAETKENLAKSSFKKAIDIATEYKLNDSLLFKPLLYLSSVYYNSFTFDSSYFYLAKAENILKKYPYLSENERLYNSFGALYFEAGNFRQSLEYFKKALLIRKKTNENYDYSFSNNLAEALQYLHKPDSSLLIFNQLLKEYPSEITLKLNIASLYLDKYLPEKALDILIKIDNKRIIGHEITYYNLLGRIYFAKKETNQAKIWLLKALDFAPKDKTKKNELIGICYRILGEIAQKEKHWNMALGYFQKSIVQLDYDFYSTNYVENPTDYNTGINSYNLFKSLMNKAFCLNALYNSTKKHTHFLFTENCYNSLVKLINASTNSFNNEDSRLDFKAEIQPIFQKYTELYLAKFVETQDQKYLKKAFETAENGKATVLSLSLNEENYKRNSSLPPSLLEREKILIVSKNALIHQLESASQTNKIVLENKLNDLNISILRLYDEFDKYPNYRSKKYDLPNETSIKSIQENLNTNDKLLYFFSGITQKGVFLVGKKHLSFFLINDWEAIETNVLQLLKILKNEGQNNSDGFDQKSKFIYSKLLKPIEGKIPENANLIIIADGKLNGFPFEILRSFENKYLIEKWPISYQFSAKLIKFNTNKKAEITTSFAPFVKKADFPDLFLPESAAEINNIPDSKNYMGSQAIKNSFLSSTKKSSIIHLATHAVLNNLSPEKSYIQFYPISNDNSKNRLYLFELSAGMFKNNSMLFLSACESLGNQNIEGEGIIGMSRAFYLAGCRNIISSIWKAEDFATAYISKQFYTHLADGNSYSKALQLAKIDLLNDPKMAQFHQPKYWAHLIFIGNNNAENNHEGVFWLLGVALLGVAIYLLMKKN